MSSLLLATDADDVYDDVTAALGDDFDVRRVRAGDLVLDAIGEENPDLVVLDLQIGNMGGMATCLDLRLEEHAGRIEPQRIVMLLDREADEFLAKRAEANGWLVKPLDPFKLRKAALAAMAPVAGPDESETPQSSTDADD